MVIELSGVQFGLKSYAIWNHKYDFRLKLHDPKFNYHFIRSILKSHNFMALNFRFWCVNIRANSKTGTGNALTSYLVCKTMSCDENSFKHNKQTNKQFWSENENSHFHESKFDSRRLNQWWKTFLSSVVEAETSRCLWRRNLRVQPVQFCDGFLLSCETPWTARWAAVKSFLF